MALQFIKDTKGNTTGVFIPIEDWQLLKSKHGDLQQEEANSMELADWQKKILDERLDDYYQNPSDFKDFDQFLNEIKDR